MLLKRIIFSYRFTTSQFMSTPSPGFVREVHVSVGVDRRDFGDDTVEILRSDSRRITGKFNKGAVGNGTGHMQVGVKPRTLHPGVGRAEFMIDFGQGRDLPDLEHAFGHGAVGLHDVIALPVQEQLEFMNAPVDLSAGDKHLGRVGQAGQIPVIVQGQGFLQPVDIEVFQGAGRFSGPVRIPKWPSCPDRWCGTGPWPGWRRP